LRHTKIKGEKEIMKNVSKVVSIILAIVLICLSPCVLTACNAPSEIEVSNIDELKSALETQNEVIKLKANISSEESIYITKKITFDLNGKTLQGSGYDGVFCVGENGVLTIQGEGKVIASEVNNYAMAIWAKSNSKVTINGGEFSQQVTGTDDQYDLIYAKDSAVITINGGTFNSVTPQWTLNIYDKDNKVAKFVVKGGKFKDYDPANSLTEPKDVAANFVAEGFKSRLIENSVYYEVVKA